MDYQLMLETVKDDALLRSLEHISLVITTMIICVVIAFPISIAFTRNRDSMLLKMILRILSVFQTIPSFAFIALAMPLLGIGFIPAIAALVAQSLLPVVRGFIVGLLDVDRNAIEAARGMGMNKRKILIEVELPLAMNSTLT